MAGTNPVATWANPDHQTQTGTQYKVNLDNDLMAGKRIAAAFAPHEATPPAMSIVVDAGMVWVSNALVEQGQQTITGIPAPTVNPRIDRIVIDKNTGAISRVAGTEAASPVAPAIPSNKLPCAQILLDNSPVTTAISNALITDERLAGTVGSEVKMLAAFATKVNRTTAVGWTDIDISGDSGADTAKIAILQVFGDVSPGGCPTVVGDISIQVRKKGTTNVVSSRNYCPTSLAKVINDSLLMVEVDGSEVLQYQILDNSGATVINAAVITLLGYIT